MKTQVSIQVTTPEGPMDRPTRDVVEIAIAALHAALLRNGCGGIPDVVEQEHTMRVRKALGSDPLQAAGTYTEWVWDFTIDPQ